MGYNVVAGIKPGVDLLGLTPQAVLGVMYALITWRELFQGRPFVQTSGTEGEHSTGSFHYQGNAFDIRRRDPGGAWKLTDTEAQLYVDVLKRSLDSQYDVVLAADHIHVEWQPKEKSA